MFKTIPLSLKAANDFVTNHHRHNKKTAGHKFSRGIRGTWRTELLR